MEQPSPANFNRRLDSWKEIAAFFGRDVRTVRRWEQKSVLPVHRVPGGTKGRVFAYESELREWLSAPPEINGAAPESVPGTEQVEPSRQSGAPAKIVMWAVILGLCALLVGGVFVYRQTHRFAVQASDVSSPPAASHKAPAPEAVQLYLQGQYYWEKRTPADLRTALDYFMQAVVQDPNYADAYVGLANCYNLMREYTMMPSGEAYTRALAAARKAVELDDQSSEAHASLAFVSFFGMWDVAAGEREFRRAVELNPGDPVPHHWWANALLALHRWPEALLEIDRAQTLDPSSSAILADKGNILSVAGWPDDALKLLQQMERSETEFRSPHLYLKYIYFRKQEYSDFLSELRKDALVLKDHAALAVANVAARGFAQGGEQGMLKAMLQEQEKFYTRHMISPTELAWTEAVLGNKSEALRYLTAAYDQRDGSLLFVEVYPEFNRLQDQPGYGELLARMNLPAPGAQ
jgi:tetratricopeptide (TPR) repeat protein